MMKQILIMIALLGFAPVALPQESMNAGNVPAREMASELTHWLTTSSGVRHNKSCRYYKNSKGRMCTENEGRACKKCGG